MFGAWKKKRIEKYTAGAHCFLTWNYKEPEPVEQPGEKAPWERDGAEVRYSVRKREESRTEDSQSSTTTFSSIKFSRSDDDFNDSRTEKDRYDGAAVASMLRKREEFSPDTLYRELQSALNQTFTDKLIEMINARGLRDSAVYRAAQMDRRLFSKIISDRNYQPSKDTAIALIFALRLPLSQATDLLSRAGFSLSHSNQRDVILEYFIREGIHDLTDINIVLENLNQKIIGRTA